MKSHMILNIMVSDPDGPAPLDSDNNVAVQEINLGQNDSVQSLYWKG